MGFKQQGTCRCLIGWAFRFLCRLCMAALLSQRNSSQTLLFVTATEWTSDFGSTFSNQLMASSKRDCNTSATALTRTAIVLLTQTAETRNDCGQIVVSHSVLCLLCTRNISKHQLNTAHCIPCLSHQRIDQTLLHVVPCLLILGTDDEQLIQPLESLHKIPDCQVCIDQAPDNHLTSAGIGLFSLHQQRQSINCWPWLSQEERQQCMQ